MTSFNKERFAELLKIAQGNRSLNHFAKDAGVTSAHISRLQRTLTNSPPNPKMLKQIAEASKGTITYEDLMEACGYSETDDSHVEGRLYLTNEEKELILAYRELNMDRKLQMKDFIEFLIQKQENINS